MSDNRSHIEEKYQWDLTTVFATDELWETEVVELTQAIDDAKGFSGHLLDSSQSLLEITEVELDLSRRLEKVYVYASMKNDQDTLLRNIKNFKRKRQRSMQNLVKHFRFTSQNYCNFQSLITSHSF